LIKRLIINAGYAVRQKNKKTCTTLAPSEYTKRHNKVVGYIHWTIYKHMGSQVTYKCYKCIPERVINVNGTAIVWDVPVIKDSTILAKRPDTVLHDKERRLAS
jgi:hypothetical protein